MHNTFPMSHVNTFITFAVAVTFVPGNLARCDWDKLDHKISKDVTDDLENAQRKFGCYYDDVSCNLFNSRTDCTLKKSTITRSKFSKFG